MDTEQPPEATIPATQVKLLINGEPVGSAPLQFNGFTINLESFGEPPIARDMRRLQLLIDRMDLSRMPIPMAPKALLDFGGVFMSIEFQVRDVRDENRGQLITLYFRHRIHLSRETGEPVGDDLVFAQMHAAVLVLLRHELNECFFVDRRHFMPDDGAHR